MPIESPSHIQGPWRIVGRFDEDLTVEVRDVNDELIQEFTAFADEWTEKEIAVIRLFVSAPDMLAALKFVAYSISDRDRRAYAAANTAYLMAVDAIERVEGGHV